jgi:hypothetical protein
MIMRIDKVIMVEGTAVDLESLARKQLPDTLTYNPQDHPSMSVTLYGKDYAKENQDKYGAIGVRFVLRTFSKGNGETDKAWVYHTAYNIKELKKLPQDYAADRRLQDRNNPVLTVVQEQKESTDKMVALMEKQSELITALVSVLIPNGDDEGVTTKRPYNRKV